MKIANEILINASLINSESPGESFEFIIDNDLTVIDSIKVTALPKRRVQPIKDPNLLLEGFLFELNHVRVNPAADNKNIIDSLVGKLKDTGVNVTEPPDQNSVSLCFKPLGEINSSVRFFINHKSELIFMSPSKPKLICCN